MTFAVFCAIDVQYITPCDVHVTGMTFINVRGKKIMGGRGEDGGCALISSQSDTVLTFCFRIVEL